MRSSSAINRATWGGDWDIVVSDIAGWANTPKPPLIFCHGANETVHTSWASEGIRLLLRDLSSDFTIIVGDFAGNSFGNSAGVNRAHSALSYIRANWSATADDPVIVGASMGACLALNYALDHPTKAVCGIIPLVDLTLAWDTNAASSTSMINTAYGGTYDPITHGPTADPAMFATSLATSLSVGLFTSSDDPYLPPSTADAFVTDRPTNSEHISLGAVGHSNASVGAARALAVPWIRDKAGLPTL